jgi:hypothetical protein
MGEGFHIWQAAHARHHGHGELPTTSIAPTAVAARPEKTEEQERKEKRGGGVVWRPRADGACFHHRRQAAGHGLTHHRAVTERGGGEGKKLWFPGCHRFLFQAKTTDSRQMRSTTRSSCHLVG